MLYTCEQLGVGTHTTCCYCLILIANFLAIHHVDSLVQLMKCTSRQADVMMGIFKFHPVDFLPMNPAHMCMLTQ